jgi:hypothetical protein
MLADEKPFCGGTFSTPTGVGVEKLAFVPNGQILGDRKCIGEPTKSFIGHPDAILFLRISSEGVFQQPRLFSTFRRFPRSTPGEIVRSPRCFRWN